MVGCSWFAREAHLPALRQLSDEGLVDVVALCSRTQQSLSQAQALLSRPAAHYTQLDELLARPDIDAVDLVLPTPLMDDAIRRSLAAGKHVISEKPCAATVARSIALLADYDRAGGERGGEQSWSVAENWPFKPTVVAIQNILRNGVLGPIESLDFLFKSTGFGKDYQGWRVSPEYRGGFLLDSSVHYVSMLRLLTGGIAEIETAVVGRRADTHAAMSVDASVRYENGVRGTFKVDMTTAAAPDEYWHLTVRCGRGVLKANFSFGLLLLQQSGGPEQLMHT